MGLSGLGADPAAGFGLEEMQVARSQGDRQRSADLRQGLRTEPRHQRLRTMAQIDEDFVTDRLDHFHFGREGGAAVLLTSHDLDS